MREIVSSIDTVLKAANYLYTCNLSSYSSLVLRPLNERPKWPLKVKVKVTQVPRVKVQRSRFLRAVESSEIGKLMHV